MRKLLVILLLCMFGFLPGTSHAGPTYYGEWSVSNISLTSLSSSKIVELNLDLTFGKRFLALNGVYETMNGNSIVAWGTVGTAFFSFDDDIVLDLSIPGVMTSTIRLDSSTLNGTIEAYDYQGSKIDEGTVTLISLE